jgi:hypothetical protein
MGSSASTRRKHRRVQQLRSRAAAPGLRAELLERRALLAASSLEDLIAAPVRSLADLEFAAPIVVSREAAGDEAASESDGSSGGGCCPVCGSSGCVAHKDGAGNTFYVLPPVADPGLKGGSFDGASASGPSPAPLADTFKLHSRPGATKVIYLDFDGHITTGTAWNSGGKTTIVTPAYDIDNTAGFSNTELERIQNIWARVVEDFSPFDVNVTTEEPALDDLRNTGGADTRWGVRVAIGGSYTDWYGASAGGVAYLTSFNWNNDTPCFVFEDNTAGGDAKATAECISHEVGHTLGLAHDGRTSPSEGYYGGHGSGATGWAPIMGVGYYRSLVQWSKGEYANADNKQDDLQIITSNNGFGYRADDYGNTIGTAYAPAGIGPTAQVFPGVIERSTDVDVFSFSTLDVVTASISPAAISPNLDVLAEIWDSSGSVLFTSNPVDALDASFSLTVSPGSYFLAVRGTGKGDPLATGYTSYASLGQYTVSLAANPPPVASTVSIAASSAVKAEGSTGATPFTFTVTRAGPTTGVTTVNWAVSQAATSSAAADDFVGGGLPFGSVSFAAGETTKTVTVEVVGDAVVEGDELFVVTLSGVTGGVLGTATAEGKIVNDDTALAIAATSAVKAEGNTGATPFSFVVTRTGSLTGTSSANWSVSGGLPNPASADDFAGGSLPSGTVAFAAGEASKTVTVYVVGDTTEEADESFVVALTEASGAAVGTGIAAALIANDDNPVPPAFSVTATNASRPEGNAASTAFTFTVTRSGDLGGTVRLNWAARGSGANPTSDDDFEGGVSPSGVLEFSPGEVAKVLTVSVAGDTVVESDEQFTVTLSNPSVGSIATATAVGTVRNDDIDALVSISAASATGVEGDAGGRPFTFTVTRSESLAGVTTVAWGVRGAAQNSADGGDFVGGSFPGGIVTFNAGERTKTITVYVSGDRLVEADEGFSVSLLDIVGGRAVTASASGLIVNDDSAVAIAAVQASRLEGNAGAAPATPFTFTVTRTGILGGTCSVGWAVAGGGANPASASDFVGGSLPSGVIVFGVGEVAKTITINVFGDTSAESNEGFTVVLSNAVGVQIARDAALATIVDDDALLRITTSTPSQAEGDAGFAPFVFTVTRSSGIASSLTVHWKAEAAGSLPVNALDFAGGVLPFGTLAFAAGETSKTITVNVAGDRAFEFDERFAINIYGDLIRSTSMTCVILNDDTGLDIGRGVAVRPEGNAGPTPFTFTVTRSGALTGAVTAQWAVSGAGANPASAGDFVDGVLPSGTVTFAPGERTKTITVNVAGDSSLEWDEAFAVTISDAVGAAIGTGTATGTILNDESAIRVVALNSARKEGNSGTATFSFTVSRVNAGVGGASVNWAVSGSGDSPADAADFTGSVLPAGTLTFGVGETSKTVTVKVNGDTLLESDEEFAVTLSGATGCEIQVGTAVSLIVSDDAALAIDIGPLAQPEGDVGRTQFSFTVNRSGALGEPASVNWAVIGEGTAPVNAADFVGSVLPSGQLSFAAGESSRVITVSVLGDLLVESDEGFAVVLSSATNARIASARASALIIGDDTGFAIGSVTVSAAEGDSGAIPFTFTVTRSGQTDAAADVAWTVTGSGTFPADAADFADGVLPSGTVSFAPNETSASVTVLVRGDLVAEAEERFAVNLSAPARGVVLRGTAFGVIRNDDTSLTLSPTSLARTEGHSGTTNFIFTVLRSGATVGTTTVNWSVAGSGVTPASAADFVGNAFPSGVVTFLPGQTAARITVAVAGDRVAEADEGFTLSLADAVNARIQIGSAGVTILNDDGPLSASVRSLTGANAKPAATPERRLMAAPTVSPAPTRPAKHVVFANMGRAAGTSSPYARLPRGLRPR